MSFTHVGAVDVDQHVAHRAVVDTCVKSSSSSPILTRVALQPSNLRWSGSGAPVLDNLSPPPLASGKEKARSERANGAATDMTSQVTQPPLINDAEVPGPTAPFLEAAAAGPQQPPPPSLQPHPSSRSTQQRRGSRGFKNTRATQLTAVMAGADSAHDTQSTASLGGSQSQVGEGGTGGSAGARTFSPTGAAPPCPTPGQPPHAHPSKPPPPQQQQPSGGGEVKGGGHSRTNLFVRNLPLFVDEKQLKELFCPFGTIQTCAIMRNIHTGESLGKAFVRYDSHEEALRAMADFGAGRRTVGDGTVLSLQWAKKQHDSAPTGDARKRMRKLFVRNIPVDVSNTMLETIFGKFGPVRSISIHTDTTPAGAGETERHIAFVTYDAEAVAEKAFNAIHNTAPFSSCNGIPLMIKLAEDTPIRHSHRSTSPSASSPIPGANHTPGGLHSGNTPGLRYELASAAAVMGSPDGSPNYFQLMPNISAAMEGLFNGPNAYGLAASAGSTAPFLSSPGSGMAQGGSRRVNYAAAGYMTSGSMSNVNGGSSIRMAEFPQQLSGHHPQQQPQPPMHHTPHQQPLQQTPQQQQSALDFMSMDSYNVFGGSGYLPQRQLHESSGGRTAVNPILSPMITSLTPLDSMSNLYSSIQSQQQPPSHQQPAVQPWHVVMPQTLYTAPAATGCSTGAHTPASTALRPPPPPLSSVAPQLSTGLDVVEHQCGSVSTLSAGVQQPLPPPPLQLQQHREAKQTQSNPLRVYPQHGMSEPMGHGGVISENNESSDDINMDFLMPFEKIQQMPSSRLVQRVPQESIDIGGLGGGVADAFSFYNIGTPLDIPSNRAPRPTAAANFTDRTGTDAFGANTSKGGEVVQAVQLITSSLNVPGAVVLRDDFVMVPGSAARQTLVSEGGTTSTATSDGVSFMDDEALNRLLNEVTGIIPDDFLTGGP